MLFYFHKRLTNKDCSKSSPLKKWENGNLFKFEYHILSKPAFLYPENITDHVVTHFSHKVLHSWKRGEITPQPFFRVHLSRKSDFMHPSRGADILLLHPTDLQR